ncbi:putative DNA-binding transcriptional regulator YafY [Nocardioides thalensis]|uniref:Putative DNA-binding transcriptional regulator YafY n=1 Tax=Nocardioides thalensis TaxID=1914755 RepID=A0A853C3L1_9ACTN|nr:transcriptional regulator [Nocardioides thalensis]NYJ01282.1 putative DNA-binding transcriptional regulator YafY [Nocardioides thalensis]
MWETSTRLLRLLTLLQTRRDWTGAELGRRLGVSARTVRNDVDRLRELGYPIEARPGVAGGYRLGAGGTLPPLLLDDDEAVAVAVALRTVAGSSITGIEETAVQALMKLQQVLPSRLRRRVSALQSATVPITQSGPTVDADALTVIAAASRDHERLRFSYRSYDGAESRREAEPYRLVHERRRWYLLAWDVDRDDWRIFRVDRMRMRTPNGPHFVPRELPPDREIAARVQRHVGEAPWRFRARVVVHAPASYVRSRMPIPVDIEELADDRCAFTPGSDNPTMLALYLGMLDAEFEGGDSPELSQALRALAARFTRAAGAGARGS